MKTKMIMIIILAGFFASCSMARLQTSDSRDYYPPTITENIKVYSTEKANHPYTIICEVVASVDALGDGSASVKYLKKKAAKLGADAIIKVELSKRNSAAISTGISGVAVKTKKAGNQ